MPVGVILCALGTSQQEFSVLSKHQRKAVL